MAEAQEEETYVDEVAQLIDSFNYEFCDVCQKDLDRHIISPDMFGKPHLWCLDEEDTEARLRIAEQLLGSVVVNLENATQARIRDLITQEVLLAGAHSMRTVGEYDTDGALSVDVELVTREDGTVVFNRLDPEANAELFGGDREAEDRLEELMNQVESMLEAVAIHDPDSYEGANEVPLSD